MQIRQINQVTPDVENLAVQASAQGFESVRRLILEHTSGANRFDKNGERLLGAFEASELIGIGGINVEPYRPEPGVGRVRRFFVAEPWRWLAAAASH